MSSQQVDVASLQAELAKYKQMVERFRLRDEKIERLGQRHEDDMEDLEKDHEEAFEKLERRHEREIEKLEHRNEREIEELENRQDREMDRLEEEFVDLFDTEEEARERADEKRQKVLDTLPKRRKR